MRFVNVLAILAMTGLSLTLFQNCSKSKFADSNADLIEQSSLSASTIFINNDALYTNSTSVRVQVNLERPMMMYLTNDPSCASGGEWQNYSPEVPWVLGSKNKSTSVYVKFKTDYTESACSTDDIFHDDIPPTISQIGGVAAVTNSASVSVSLTASDSGSGVDKILCPSDVSGCGNAVSVMNSAEGQRNNIFYSLDKAGNKSAPLTVSWLYDKTGPVIAFNTKPGLKSKDLQAGFVVSGQDNYTAAADIKYRRSLDGGAYVDTSATFSVNVSEGDHTLSVEAFDKAGNKSNILNYTWTVGTKLPSLTFTKTPKAYDNQAGSFEFIGEDQFKGALVKYECSLNKAAYTVCSSPVVLDGAKLTQGSNTFSVRGYDSLGMMAEKEHQWVFDTVKPSLSFIKKPAAFSNKAAEEVQVQVSATEANLESIEFFVDGTSVQKLLLNNYVMSNLSEIKHSVRAVAVDKAGNSSDPVDPNANYSFWSDFTPPVVSIAALPDYSSNVNQTFNVSVTDNNTDPGNAFSYYYQLDSAGAFAPFTLPLQVANLTNGDHLVLVYAYDKAGNKSVTVPSESIYIDLLPPVISIIKKPSENMATGSNSIINFTLSDAGSGIKADSLVCSLTIITANGAGPKNTYACAAGQDVAVPNNATAKYEFEISVKDNLLQSASAKIVWDAADQFIAHTTKFDVSQQVNSNVDILFMVGNDQSMTTTLPKLKSAFAGFLSKVQGLNYRLAITTTDFSGDNDGSSGNIYRFDNNAYFLTPNSGTPEQIDTWFRAKLDVGTSQNESANKDKALTAFNQFLDKVLTTDSKGVEERAFYRPDAVLVTIIVDHRDEITEGNTVYTSSNVFLNGSSSVQGLYNRLGETKSYLNHSSVVLNEDSACRDAENGYYGIVYQDLARDTGGISASICSPNYTNLMNNFGNAILTKVTQIQLDCAPVDEAGDGQLDISISYKSSDSATPVAVARGDYSVTDKVVRFINPPSTVGEYTVNYSCLSWAN